MKLNLGTVFSGIGAIEYALKRMKVDHRVIFACDNDKFVKEAYLANYKVENWYDDISKIDPNKYRNKIDILVGGPPCQPFSTVGDLEKFEDDRGKLIFEFFKILKIIKPNYFIFENVRNLWNDDHTRDKMIELLNSTGFKYKAKILNSKNYGIPQNRRRLFIVGWKSEGVDFEFPKKVKLKSEMFDFLEDCHHISKEDCVHSSNEILDVSSSFNLATTFEMRPNKKVESKYTLSDKVKAYVKSSGTKNFYSKPEWDLKIARPILSTMHKMHRAGVDNYISIDDHKDEGLRRLTPREALRLMGFDDNFKQVVSDTQTYRQAGNSIVVDVLINILHKFPIVYMNRIMSVSQTL